MNTDEKPIPNVVYNPHPIAESSFFELLFIFIYFINKKIIFNYMEYEEFSPLDNTLINPDYE